MKITIDGKDYWVKFLFYRALTLDCGGNIVEVRNTQCQLFSDAEGIRCISCGIAFQNPSDQFCKETGRRIAFDHALVGFSRDRRTKYRKTNCSLDNYMFSLVEAPPLFNKDQRRQAWEQYFQAKARKG
jgi:hypothetical protein